MSAKKKNKNPNRISAIRTNSTKVKRNPQRKLKGLRKIWYYFPLPIAFNVAMLMMTVISLPSNNSILAVTSNEMKNNGTFMNLSLLLLLSWLAGTVISFKVSPLFYEINKHIQLKKIFNNFKLLLKIALVISAWILFVSLLSTGVQSIITLKIYRDIAPAFMYGFGFSYTYTVALFVFYLTHKNK